TILRLGAEEEDGEGHWVVVGRSVHGEREAMASAQQFLADATKKDVVVEAFQTSFFPYAGAAIKEFFETLKVTASPDIVFTHFRHDLHQDHRVVSELTWNTYRDHLILE